MTAELPMEVPGNSNTFCGNSTKLAPKIVVIHFPLAQTFRRTEVRPLAVVQIVAILCHATDNRDRVARQAGHGRLQERSERSACGGEGGARETTPKQEQQR